MLSVCPNVDRRSKSHYHKIMCDKGLLSTNRYQGRFRTPGLSDINVCVSTEGY